MPIRRAGITKIGSSTSASTVTCHASPIMTASASTSWMALDSTAASVEVMADCAPITSLLSLLTSAPVRVRVKKAIGICCTWAKTALRRSTIRPSPMRVENQRETSPTTASSTASAAMPTARPTTAATAPSPPPTITLTTRPASSGVSTPTVALTTVSSRNASSQPRYGLANRQIRGIVPFATDVGASARARDAAQHHP